MYYKRRQLKMILPVKFIVTFDKNPKTDEELIEIKIKHIREFLVFDSAATRAELY